MRPLAQADGHDCPGLIGKLVPGVFHLPLRQTEGLLGSILGLIAPDLEVPDHSTLSRRAKTLIVTPAAVTAKGPLHLLVDSTGLKLGEPGEWLIEKHGAQRRRAWRKLHLGVDAGTGTIIAAALTGKDIDDAAQLEPLLDHVEGSVASVTGDGADDQEVVYRTVGERHPEAAVIAPPRATAVPGPSTKAAPTQRDRHLQFIKERGRMAWQKARGDNDRALAEAAISRYKRVIGDTLRSQAVPAQAVETQIAAKSLNRMLELGRPESVRVS
jgi:Transposase DDE domain